MIYDEDNSTSSAMYNLVTKNLKSKKLKFEVKNKSIDNSFSNFENSID